MATLFALLSLDVTAEPPVQKALFVKRASGYDNYRIPAPITTHKGTLLVFCEGREAEETSYGEIAFARFSLEWLTDGKDCW